MSALVSDDDEGGVKSKYFYSKEYLDEWIVECLKDAHSFLVTGSEMHDEYEQERMTRSFNDAVESLKMELQNVFLNVSGVYKRVQVSDRRFRRLKRLALNEVLASRKDLRVEYYN